MNTAIIFYVFFHKAIQQCHTHLLVFVSFRLFFIYVYFRLGTNRPHSTFHVTLIIVCKNSSKESTASIWAKDGTGKPICTAATSQKCFFFFFYCLRFVIHFLFISLFASIYSKFPKTKSCLSVDISVQTVLWNIIWREKNVINCVYILVFFTMGSYWPHGTVNVTFFMVPEQD
jgi:hypothetical protein